MAHPLSAAHGCLQRRLDPSDGPRQRPKRLFRWVHYHSKSKTWVVQRRGFAAPGSSKCQLQAAKLAASAFGMSVQQLRLRAPQQATGSPQTRRFLYVHYHKRDKAWVVQRRGSKWTQTHGSQLEAAKLAAKVFKTTISDLRLPRRETVRLEKWEAKRQRFRDLWAIYRTSDPNNPALPGDLQDLSQRATKSKKSLLFSATGLSAILLLSKYGPHRHALEQAWQTLSSCRPKQGPDHLACENVAVMRETLRLLSGQSLPTAWLENVGRHCTHHSGLIVLAAQSFGVIKGASKNTVGPLILGKRAKPFVFTSTTCKMLTKFQIHLQFEQALLQAAAPTNTKQWSEQMARLEQAIKGPPKVTGFPSATSYRAKWFIRTWLLLLMRKNRVRRLRVSANMAVSEFASLFPDQRGWITALAGTCKTVTQLFKSLQYDGPPELFSLYACLFGDKQLVQQLQHLGDSWLLEHKKSMIDARLMYAQQHGINPHPAILLKDKVQGDR